MNIILKYRQVELDGKTPTQWLLSCITDASGEHISLYKADRDGYLLYLFVAPCLSLSIYKKHPDILLLDCIYKTNRFNMLLLNIIGLTNMRSSFQVAAIFLKGETKPDYAWALNQLYNKVIQPLKIDLPRIIITDRDKACINALNDHPALGGIPYLLCQ